MAIVEEGEARDCEMYNRPFRLPETLGMFSFRPSLNVIEVQDLVLDLSMDESPALPGQCLIETAFCQSGYVIFLHPAEYIRLRSSYLGELRLTHSIPCNLT